MTSYYLKTNISTENFMILTLYDFSITRLYMM